MLMHRLLFLVAASLLGGAIATLPGSGQAQDATPVASPAVGEKTTAIVVSATNDPLRVSGSDGVDHLEYDLLVTNGFAAPVTLTSIAVTAPDGETLLRLEGDALVTATQPLLGRTPTADDSRLWHGGGGHGRHGPTRPRGGRPEPPHHL